MKEPILTVTRKNFRFDHFRCPGHGGQNVNKVSTGVRITHMDSGYYAESCEFRTQHQNLKRAFEKLCKDRRFVAWLKNKALKVEDISIQVDRAMEPKNLKFEVRKNNKWEKENE